MVDFRAYYCASLAQREAPKSLFLQSIQSCERSAAGAVLSCTAERHGSGAIPSVRIGVALSVHVLALRCGGDRWWSLLVLALGAAAYALARRSRSSRCWWAGPPSRFPSVLSPSRPGISCRSAIAAVVVAALCAARRRFALAVAAIALAMVEPQVALPAAIAFFVAYPAIRLRLCAAAGALVALSLVTAGFAQTVAYLRTCCPLTRSRKFPGTTSIAFRRCSRR